MLRVLGEEGFDIVLSHSGIIEPEISVSVHVNLVSSCYVVVKMDVDRKVSNEGDRL